MAIISEHCYRSPIVAYLNSNDDEKISTLLLASVFILMTGCTHNDGDIGPWFGTWQLENVMIDDKPEEDYHHDIFWQFQKHCVLHAQGHRNA